ncbi:gp186 [Listeria phage A511]|uniref:Gp186 n=1 Tax=Listeria phage A511 TaxID=2908169 RepID=A8AT20_BPA51|nr:gp186 [Listeria phage A511]AAY52967.1 gp186 [Listeria phage A511]
MTVKTVYSPQLGYTYGNLEVEYADVKSFYGKAYFRNMHTDDHTHVYHLYSYDTLILEVVDGVVTAMTDDTDHYSMTTNRHINEFLAQYEDDYTGKLSKKELLEKAKNLGTALV